MPGVHTILLSICLVYITSYCLDVWYFTTYLVRCAFILLPRCVMHKISYYMCVVYIIYFCVMYITSYCLDMWYFTIYMSDVHNTSLLYILCTHKRNKCMCAKDPYLKLLQFRDEFPVLGLQEANLLDVVGEPLVQLAHVLLLLLPRVLDVLHSRVRDIAEPRRHHPCRGHKQAVRFPRSHTEKCES